MFVETDPLGGQRPVQRLEGRLVELLVRSHVETYFAPRRIPVATARAGNVLGGGDFSSDRLVPDIFRSARTKSCSRFVIPARSDPGFTCWIASAVI